MERATEMLFKGLLLDEASVCQLGLQLIMLTFGR